MSKTPEDLLNELPVGKVLERLKTYGGFYIKHFQPHYNGIYVNLKLLRHAVEKSLLTTLYVKNYHGIEYADEHKRAAFSMYWIARIKPIQIDSDANVKESHLLINEIFGVYIGLGHLNINCHDISPKYFLHLLYTLHNRNVTPEELASEMYLLQCAAWNKKP